jgi:uncharacterized membrane protein (DUF106 family)
MAKKRKTREEKIIAQLRRELKEAKKELKGLKREEKKLQKKKQVKKNKPLTSNLFLKMDLTKTLILSILAIATELVVYWLYHKANTLEVCWLTIKGFDIFGLPARLKTKLF